MLWARLGCAVLVLDQLVKQIVLRLLDQADGHQIVVIPGLFNLVEVWNAGVSFGMLGGAGLPPWVLTVVSLVSEPVSSSMPASIVVTPV